MGLNRTGGIVIALALTCGCAGPAPQHPSTTSALLNGDVNGDGLADVVQIDDHGSVWVRRSTGTAFTAAELWLAQGLSTKDWPHIWLADINGDGTADLVAQTGAGGVSVAASNGTGFAAPASWLAQWPVAPDNATAPAPRAWLSDVSGDGLVDLVGIDAAGDVWVALNDQKQLKAAQRWLTKPSSPDWTTWFDGRSHSRIWLGDVNGDHASDLIVVADNGDLMVAPAQKSQFGVLQIWLADSVFKPQLGWFDAHAAVRVWSADASGDELMDLVGVAPQAAGDGDIWVAESRRLKFDQAAWLYRSGFSTDAHWFDPPGRVMVADVDGNGHADLVGIGTDGNVLIAHARNDGVQASPAGRHGDYVETHGAPVPPTVLAGWFKATGPANAWLADVSGDHITDLVGLVGDAAHSRFDQASIARITIVPPTVERITNLNQMSLDGKESEIEISFSRKMDCNKLDGAMSLREITDSADMTVQLRPSGPRPSVGCRKAVYKAQLTPVSNAAVKLIFRVSQSLTDVNGQDLDGNANGRPDPQDDYTLTKYFSGPLRAAAAKINITPGSRYLSGVPPKSGWGYCPRYGTPGAFDNPLFARALVLGSSDQTLVIINVDLTGFNSARLRRLISSRTQIPGQNIITSAIHAHNSVRTTSLTTLFGDDRRFAGSAPPANYMGFYSYLEWVEDSLADAVANAINNMVPVRIGVGQTTAPTLGYNRRGNFPIDPTVNIVQVRRADNNDPVAILVHHGLHPVMIDGGSTALNSDFPGYMAQCLENNSCGLNTQFPVAMFLQAAAGDVNPKGMNGGPRTSGQTLAQLVVNALPMPVATDGMHIRLQQSAFSFPGTLSCRTCSDERPALKGSNADLYVESVTGIIGTPTTPLLAFVTVPGEPFSSLALGLTAGSPVTPTLLLGYANEYMGYFPDTTAVQVAQSINCAKSGFDFRCYGVVPCSNKQGAIETGPTFFNLATPTPGEVIIKTAIQRLKELSQ